ERPRDLGAPGVAAVAHHDRLEVRVVELGDALQAVRERRSAVECADDDRDPRPRTVLAPERSVREGLADRGERRLWPAVAVGQPEVPVVDVEPPAVPFVSPGEDEGPRTAGAVGGADLAAAHGGLDVLAVPAGVEAYRRHH